MNKDKRKEAERRVNESMKEIHDKGFTWERAERYQKLQLEWWRVCDEVVNTFYSRNE